MTKEQAVILKLMKNIFFGGNEAIEYEGIQLKELVDELHKQDLFVLLYNHIEPLSRFGFLKQLYLKEYVKNIQHIDSSAGVFERFNLEGIPFIPLKGITLRDVYPELDNRTMNDTDLLVKEEDYKRAADLLLAMDYILEADTAHHLVFMHQDREVVELHHQLSDYRRQQHETLDIDILVWQKSIPGLACGVKTQLMCPTHTLVHSLIHAVSHFIVGGIGLKQVLDYGLYYQKNGHLLDMTEFKMLCESFSLVSLADSFAFFCESHFGLQIPLIEPEDRRKTEELSKSLLEDIWKAGNLGGVAMQEATGSVFLKDPHQNGEKTIMENALLLVKYFSLELSKAYPKAYKKPVLRPFLYVPFFFNRIFSRGGGGFKAVGFAVRSVTASRKRYALAKKFKLR